MPTPLPRILCVDDEPNLLAGLKRQLRSHFQVDTAESGTVALEMLSQASPYEVIVSDMRMAEMDGATFLAKAKQLLPDTMRILLTGQTDIPQAIAAVNNGGIFRFLTKPIDSVSLLNAIHSGVEQHRLINAKRELLEKTLHGSIKTLIDILSITHPQAFGRSQIMLAYLKQLAKKHSELASWQNEIACMLSQIGFLTLPPEIFERWYLGNNLNKEEMAMLNNVPNYAIKLLAAIPQLDEVKAIIAEQNANYNSIPISNVSLGARAIKILSDFESLQHQGYDHAYIIGILQARDGAYDLQLLSDLKEVVGLAASDSSVYECGVDNLKLGMFLAEDVLSHKRQLLIPKGQEVSPLLIERLKNFAQNVGVREPLRLKSRP